MAKTEIVKLETKVRDLERSLSLYSSRLKMFEEKEQNLFSERLSCASNNSAPQYSAPVPAPRAHSHCCAPTLAPPCHGGHASRSPCQATPCSYKPLEEKLKTISQHLKAIKANLPQKTPKVFGGVPTGVFSSPSSPPSAARQTASNTATNTDIREEQNVVELTAEEQQAGAPGSMMTLTLT